MSRSMKSSFFFLTALLVSGLAFAGQYDLKEMTPVVKEALAGRQGRYETLQSLKASGDVGESNEGYVEVLKGLPHAKQVAAAENTDRRVIYHAIVTQNQLGPQGMAEVQKAFAEVQREKARAGDFVQSSSGKWSQK